MLGLVKPPQPAPNVNVYREPGKITLHCRVCHASLDWQSGAYGEADILWFRLRHQHDEPARKVRR